MLNYTPTVGEINDMPSMTVPDQAMSMAEILSRFARGLPIEAGRVPIYDEENDLPDIRTLDLVERADLAEQYRNELSEYARNAKKPLEAAVAPISPSDNSTL